MYRDIRKLSVGAGFPNKAMHYQTKSVVRFKDIDYEVHSIIPNNESGKVIYDIYISDGSTKLLWKSITSEMPIVIEYNIDFE